MLQFLLTMPKLININDTTVLSGYTLILPTVSVGNVPQLAVDLLITTYNFNKITTIWHPAIVSSVGDDPYHSDRGEICTACELYGNKELKLATIQLRSTVETKLALKFFRDLQEAILPLNLKNVVILSSAFDYELRNINNEKFYYISNEEIEDVMESNNVKLLEPSLNGKYFINGSGFATKLYEILKLNVNCTLLVKYVSEGDNRPDALMTLRKMFKLFAINDSEPKIIFPTSWEFVFGGPPPLGMY
ncbi:hypothetical protein NQ314_004750 [Rhamnusium bicolor]|uniref:Proteasome assembly chaperone 2 n=1 Tax=Rhamnusium bicolor TaxID=1586634 RepID=A0AAV8ZIN6_9CUCU|nr:hypothetical protein NQ314_004750 [Rhamnusium bicolor]